MQYYKNLGGNSGVEAFEIGASYIDVRFRGTWCTYRYSYASAGRENVEHMKQLAMYGEGLNSFIQRCVKYDYEKRF